MSLRKLARQVGVSQPFLSQIRAGKRPMPEALKAKLEALGAYHLLIADKQAPDTESRVGGVRGGAEGQNRTADTWIFSPLLYR
jgi:transcriptional regulator with XRE-family HTH domain